MTTLYFLLALLAAISFALAASGRVASRWNLVALGLLLWVMIAVVQYGRAVF